MEQGHPAGTASPRLAWLLAEIGETGPAALDRFWREVEDRGTPLVQDLNEHAPVSPSSAAGVQTADDAAESALLTFVWRHEADATSAAVRGYLRSRHEDHDAPRHAMTRLPGTDIWHVSVRAPRALRAAPHNHSPRAFPVNEEDPGVADVFGSSYTVSTVALPHAPPQPWFGRRPGVPEGRTTLHRLPSARLGRERRVWVHTTRV